MGKYDKFLNAEDKERKLDLLGETMILLGADLYQALYDMMEESDYSAVASMIRDSAIKFENELDWDNVKSDKDYITELEKFEVKLLEEGREMYKV